MPPRACGGTVALTRTVSWEDCCGRSGQAGRAVRRSAEASRRLPSSHKRQEILLRGPHPMRCVKRRASAGASASTPGPGRVRGTLAFFHVRISLSSMQGHNLAGQFAGGGWGSPGHDAHPPDLVPLDSPDSAGGRQRPGQVLPAVMERLAVRSAQAPSVPRSPGRSGVSRRRADAGS